MDVGLLDLYIDHIMLKDYNTQDIHVYRAVIHARSFR